MDSEQPDERRRSVLQHALLRVLPPALLLLAVGGVAVYQSVERSLLAGVEERLRTVAVHGAELVAAHLDEVRNLAALLSSNRLVVNALVDDQSRRLYLRPLLESLQVPGEGARVTLADYRGRVLASNRDGRSYQAAPWADSVMAGQELLRVSPEGILAASPVVLGELPEGMVVVEYSGREMHALLGQSRFPSAVTVLDAEGRVLHSSHPELPAPGGTIEDLGDDWLRQRAAVPAVSGLQVVGTSRRTEALSLLGAVRDALAIGFTLSALALLGGTAVTAWLISQPLRRFSHRLQRVQNREDLIARFEEDGPAEYRRLAGAFNRMIEALRESTVSRDFFDDLFRAMDEATVATDLHGHINTMNPAAERLLGLPSAQLAGSRRLWEFWRPEPGGGPSPAERFETLAEQARTAGAARCDLTVNTAQYAKVPVTASLSAVRNRRGELLGYLAIMTDISERRRAQAAFSEQAARTQAILDTAVDGILTVDEKGVIESVNPAVGRIFGYSEDELRGRNVGILMAQDDRLAHDHHIQRYLRTGQARIIGVGREIQGMRRDGTIIPLEISVGETRMGGRTLFTGIVRDITERKALDRIKSEFVSVVSHELRTPLTSLSGALRLVESGAAGQLPERAQDMVSLAQRNSQRLIHLVNDILDVEKLESGRIRLVREPVALEALLRDAQETNQAYADHYGVSIEAAHGCEGLQVLGDRDRLNQVLANLLSNAAKFSPRGETVSMDARCGEYWVEVCVTDRGPGIPEDFQEKVFQKFSQADSSDTRAKGGTGLGLAITRAIVEAHGGEIGFDTAPGQGTTFWFRLPRTPAEQATVAAGPQRASTLNPSRQGAQS